MQGLVSAHLERINARVFEQFQDVITQLVSKRHGVYALYKSDRLYYVGLARDLKTRLKQHLKDQHAKRWDRFSLYLTHTDEHLKELETLVVHISQPKGNIQHGKFARSRNLRPQLKQLLTDKVTNILSGAGRRRPSAAMKLRRRTPSSRVSAPRQAKSPSLRGLLPANSQLRAVYKGKEYTAMVDDQGRIIIDGLSFNSPSSAATYVTKGPKDGWIFWRCNDEKEGWVLLNERRKRMRGEQITT
jgi:hypothetical protein